MELVRWQVSLGPRAPGLPGHRKLREELAGRLQAFADRFAVQEFAVPLPAGRQVCANLSGLFRSRRPIRPPVLVGTHFDTRLIADRDSDPKLRSQPIPGANDGGSGTAVLLGLLPELERAARRGELAQDTTLVFFDAEDVGDIGGLPFAFGALTYCQETLDRDTAAVLVLDMVGGSALELDVDAHALGHQPSMRLTREVFSMGRLSDPRVFRGARVRHIIADHFPFLEMGIASCLLIDLNYPQWHTQADLPQAMSPDSLATIAGVVMRFLLAPAP
jgi:Zn-dependent M28 family amino/carboxypeptidase